MHSPHFPIKVTVIGAKLRNLTSILSYVGIRDTATELIIAICFKDWYTMSSLKPCCKYMQGGSFMGMPIVDNVAISLFYVHYQH